ncbi:MAG: FAD binding domain-containing protein [Paracoccaceae bacterium]
MIEVHTFSQAAEAARTPGHILGGGTLLMRQVNYAPQTIEKLIRVTDPELQEIRADSTGIRIGAGVTMASIINHPDLSVLAPVARAIGAPALRNMATVGGNLFAPHPYGDLAVALLALDAFVIWSDGREEDMETFFQGRERTRGMVTHVVVPRVQSGQLRFRKVSRTRPKGISVMSIAVYLPGGSLSGRGARIAFGAMGPTPLRAKAAEAALENGAMDASGVAAACSVCGHGLAPQDDALASAWYRNEVAPVHLRRCLEGET